MGRLGHFLAYHNAVPIAVAVMLLGASGAFAATNPEAIYTKSEKIVSVDNSYIVSKDFSNFTPVLQIVRVTEDADNYYVEYELETIDVVDGAWRDVIKVHSLTVARGVLGEYRDLGLYVTEQLKQVIDREISYLKEVQDIERKIQTPKVVTTEYSGLVGLFLDDTMETLPGYVPVVTPPPAELPAVTASESNAGTPPARSGSSAPTIQILGGTPITLTVGDTYTDLGAVATDDVDEATPQIRVAVNGEDVESVSIDTSHAGSWQIMYTAIDSEGNSTQEARTVIVRDPAAPQPSEGGSPSTEEPPAPPAPAPEEPPVETPTETPVETPATAPESTPEPEPVPEPTPPAEPDPEPAPPTTP